MSVLTLNKGMQYLMSVVGTLRLGFGRSDVLRDNSKPINNSVL